MVFVLKSFVTFQRRYLDVKTISLSFARESQFIFMDVTASASSIRRGIFLVGLCYSIKAFLH